MPEGSITYLQSIPRLAKHLQAERLPPNPNDRGVIDRNSTIVVEKELMDTEKSMQMGATGDVITAPPVDQRPEVTYAVRPEASDPLMVRPDVQIGEHGIGAPPMMRTASEVNANQPIQGAVQAKPQPVAPKPVTPTPAPRPQPVINQPAPEAVRPKMRVKLSNDGMGKITISVQSVAVSENCVVLAYPADAENIVEPPVCGLDNPIQVDYGDKRYKCMYGGQAVELAPYYLVILIRIPDDEEEEK